MRLLILTQKVDENDDNLGFFHRWIEEFSKQCESVIVICLYQGVHHLPANVRVLSLGKESGASRFLYLKRFYSYIWNERKNYDVVFVHMNQIYVILGGLLWRMMGKRVGMWYAHGKVSLSLRIATLFAHTIFSSTEAGFRIDTPKKHIVGQGIDATLFLQKENYEIGETLKLVTFGRVTPAKDIEGMIDVVATLCAQGVHTTLDVIGSGEQQYVDELKRYADSKGVGDKIVLLGGMPYARLAHELAKYDAFINLGKTGSLDKALLDAAVAGLPVVTTNQAFGEIGEVTKNVVETISTFKSITVENRIQEAYRVRGCVMVNHTLEGLIKRIITAV